MTLPAAAPPAPPAQPPAPADRPADLVESALASLWRAVNDLSRLKPPIEGEYRVTIFGSARIRPGEPAYAQVRELARRLAASGCAIVTGGGPGLMQAANEGERLGDPEDRRRTVGVRVELPFEQGANPFVELCYTHQTFFSRLHQFVRLTDAFVVVDGGIGTTLESLMVWQLLQVRHIRDVPLVLVGPMWRALVEWARAHMLRPETPLAGAADLDIPILVDGIEDAYSAIERHRRSREGK